MKYYSLIILLFFPLYSYSQTEKIKTYYSNGHIKSKGKIYIYDSFDKRLNEKAKYYYEIQKKNKKWTYWHANGNLERIEHFDLVIDLNHNSYPVGLWKYYNYQGIKYREEIYKNGKIHFSTIEIYNDTLFAGKIIISNNSYDTIIKQNNSDPNLILNPGFELFKYKPVLVLYEGKSRIEEWIPYWTTPGNYTPDYINHFRQIRRLNYNFLYDLPLQKKFNHVGLGLYQVNNKYSEYIQGQLRTQLEAGKIYCVRLSLILGAYSCYTINKMGVLTTDKPIKINKNNEADFAPKIIFNQLPENCSQWKLLCKVFKAAGNEKYITIGRFENVENCNIKKIEPLNNDNFDLDQAAYYILDEIELFEVQFIDECKCSNEVLPVNNQNIDYKDFESNIIERVDLGKIEINQPVILRNVNFEFGKYDLLPESENDLTTLFNYLKNNRKIEIEILGHTDNIGTDEYNIELSMKRAKAVYDWLIAKGINSNRLRYKGYGKRMPLVENQSEKGRAINRRVEFKKIKKSN